MQNFKEILRMLDDQGWLVEKTSNCHYRCIPPDKTKSIVTIADSTEWRAQRNVIRDLKANGFLDDEPKPKSKKEPKVKSEGLDEWAKGLAAVSETPVDQEESSFYAVDKIIQPPDPEELLDRNFRALKEAKAYMQLAKDQLLEVQRQLDDVSRRFEEAKKEAYKASEDLAHRKEDFDRLFHNSLAEAV